MSSPWLGSPWLGSPWLGSAWGSAPTNPELLLGQNAMEVADVDATTLLTSNYGLEDVFESQAAETNGTNFAFHINSNATAAGGAGFYRALTELTAGVNYTLSVDVRHVGTGSNWRIGIGNGGINITVAGLTITVSDTAWQNHTVVFTAPTTPHFAGRESSAANTGGLYIDNLSIKAIV